MTDAERLIKRLSATSRTVVAAESCTGGLVADLIVRIPGASQVFWGSIVSYTVEAKIKILGLEEALIRHYGAVSREAACAMVLGALERSAADTAVSVTGLAGPEGDETSAVPVGTVWIGTLLQGEEVQTRVFHYTGSRNEIRSAAALDAIKELLARVI